ncbi:MAG: GHKL domain-containing protein [Candidatus Gastranaerophilales bacterium]|nr:GHKL domain-containing protein [Candidatus Gastranaerophilales bacterium]
MIYIVDNLSNYFIYLFLIHFGFRIEPRKNKLFVGASALTMLLAGVFNAYYDLNSPIVYMIWSVLSICLFFEDRLGHLVLLSAALMYFTGIIDTFSVMLIQVVRIGGGITGTDIEWWMEPAYLLSFLVYLLVYLRLLKKNEVYLCDIGWKYQLALLVQGSIFQMFYNFVFVFFNENHTQYDWSAYAIFFISIAGVLYSIFLTLDLAIKNILSNRQNRELQSFAHMQKQQYDYQLQQSVAVRRFKHDLVNHIGVLRELMNEKKMDDAKKYIDTIWNIQDEFDLKIHTGDNFLDVILNYYLYLAEKEKIAFAVSGKLTETMPLEMFDLTTLMGNILQNAIEAAIKADVPRIRVELIEHERELFIVVSNSAVKKIDTKREFFMTSKKDRVNHGFGLKNIAATVEKYHGEYYVESMTENGETLFQISVAIPKENKESVV